MQTAVAFQIESARSVNAPRNVYHTAIVDCALYRRRIKRVTVTDRTVVLDISHKINPFS
jgi:hypothetical protein